MLTGFLPLVLSLPSLLVVAGDSSGEYASLVEWIVAGGGFVTSRQVMKTDSDGVRGIFATEDLPESTLLARIPWTHLISDRDMCQNIRNLRDEMEKGAESHYAPYLKTLENYEPHLPYAWEGAALDLIKNLPPQDWTRHSTWFRSECGNFDDPLTQRALEVYLPRSAGHGNGHIFCPVFDHYNHRNGDWHNTMLEVEWGEHFEIYTSREVEEGEQLYNEYGMGTTGIFRDYAFVEPFPQLWHIEDLAFELPDDVSIIWHSPKPDGQSRFASLTTFHLYSRRLWRIFHCSRRARADSGRSRLCTCSHPPSKTRSRACTRRFVSRRDCSRYSASYERRRRERTRALRLTLLFSLLKKEGYIKNVDWLVVFLCCRR